LFNRAITTRKATMQMAAMLDMGGSGSGAGWGPL
jgi:hypothetical protein